MIWNDEVLFIHAPKTAGMSMTQMLMARLPGRVFVTGQVIEELRENQTQLPGGRHETLAEAACILEKHGIALSNFEKIFVVMREPYTLEISRYNYLRLDLPVDKGVAQAIAMKGDFKEYLRSSPFFGYSPPRLDLYYHCFGCIPQNLICLRYERLEADVSQYLEQFLDDQAELPHLNKTGNSVFERYYDAEAEELCFERHRWFFEKGFYARRLL